MPHITAVLFDYGLVLSGPADPAAWERMKRILNADEPRFHAAYWAPRHPYDRGDLTAQAYWTLVGQTLDRPLDTAQIDTLIDADIVLWTQPNHDMIDWAARLQQAGIKTGILSNIGDAMEIGVRAACPWLDGFAHYTFSHNLRLAKPELAIYQHAAQGLQTDPANILFIDDREDNLAAARSAGMNTMAYTGHTTFVADMLAAGFQHLLEIAPATTSAPNR